MEGKQSTVGVPSFLLIILSVLITLPISARAIFGARLPGDKFVRMKESLAEFLKLKDSDWWLNFQSEIAEEQGCECQQESPLLSLDEIMQEDVMRAKGRFAACLSSFSKLSNPPTLLLLLSPVQLTNVLQLPF